MFSSQDEGRDERLPLVAAFWNGTPVIVRGRGLSPSMLHILGGFTALDIDELGKGLVNLEQVSRYAEQSYKILRLFLDCPTYEQIFASVGRGDMIKDSEAKIREIEELVDKLPHGAERQELELALMATRGNFNLLLPADFVAPLVYYAAGIRRDEIKELTRGTLADAAEAAEREGGTPSDRFKNPFTAFLRDDIDYRARAFLSERRKAEGSEVKA
jgi:hypothetical protein